MNRFALPVPTVVVLEHLNTRAEMHGDESVPAIDLKLALACSNDVLDQFHPSLKSWLYFKSPRPPTLPEQGTLDLSDNERPDLRFPELDPLRWSADLQGYTLVVDYGLGGKSLIRLADCAVNSFRFECCEGGTVQVTFRVQRSQPDERAVGKLSSLLKRELHVTLTPSPEAQAVLDEMPQADADADSRSAIDEFADATDSFLAQHARN